MLLHGGFFFFTAATHCVSARGYINVQAFIVGEEHTVVMYRDYEQGREEELAGVWREVVDLVVWDRKIFFFLFKWVLRFHETSRYPAGHGPTSQSDDRPIYHGINLLPLRLVTTGLLSESGEKVFIKVNTHTLIFKAFSSAYIYYEPEI